MMITLLSISFFSAETVPQRFNSIMLRACHLSSRKWNIVLLLVGVKTPNKRLKGRNREFEQLGQLIKLN